MDRKPFSLHSRIASFRFAFRGIALLLRTQHNARIHLLATACVVAPGILAKLDRVEWALITISIAVVWAAEAFNTAIEFLVDLASPEFNTLAGYAKDVTAAAVLFTALGALGVGLWVFWPHLTAAL